MEQVLKNDPNKKYSRYYTYVKPIISDPVISGYFGLVATLLLCAFFIIFAISPTISTILGLTKKIDDQKKLIKTMDNKINSLITAQENYSQVEPYLPLLNSAFPQTPLPEDIITGVVGSSSSSAVAISSLQIGQANLTGTSTFNKDSQPSESFKKSFSNSLNIPTTDFSVSVLGSADNIRRFAGHLLKLPRIITLSVFSIAQNESTTDTTQNKMTADINGFTYYLK